MKLIHLIAVMAAPSLSACQQQETTPTPATTQPAAAATISAANGRLVLPAVKGNPGAAYFTIDNRTGTAVAVTSVAIDRAAKAEIHQTQGGTMTPVERLEAAPGKSVEFTPGGMHIMVFDLDPNLLAGGTAKLTVTFADGEKLAVPLTVEPAGGAMAGMEHGDMH